MKSVEEVKGGNPKGISFDLRNLTDLRLAIEVGDRIVCPTYPLPTNPSWQLFEAFLKEKLHQNNFKVCYRDEDGDEVCLSSDEEFYEALKVYKQHSRILMLKVMPNATDAQALNLSSVDGDGFPKQMVLSENKIENTETLPGPSKKTSKVVSDTEPRNSDLVKLNIKLPDQTMIKNKKEKGTIMKEPDTPPEWFTTYMEKFKGDISAEITKKVMHRMQKLMINNNGTQGLKKSKSEGEALIKEVKDEKKEIPSITYTQEVEGAVCSSSIIHVGIFCDNCGDAIVGIRYKCGNCTKYDLCEKCEAENDHDKYHVFVKIKRPAPAIGIKKKTGKLAPLLKDILYEGEIGAEKLHKDLAMERGRRLLKRLEKQAQKLKKEQDRYRLKLQDKEAHHWDSSNTGHRHWDSGRHSPLYHYRHPYASYPAKSSHHPAPKKPKPASVAVSVAPPPTAYDNLFKPLIMNATFLKDETIPDGTQMQPNTKFTKIWRMLNSGSKPWGPETKLKCLWGTQGLTPVEDEVPAPHLLPGEEGIISVDFIASSTPGNYDSHWRLSHKNERFGHRIWCNVVVDNPIILDVIQPSSLRLVDCVQDCKPEIKLLQDSENGEKEQLLVEETSKEITEVQVLASSPTQDSGASELNIPLGDENQNEEQDFSVLPSLLPPLPLYATKPKHLHKGGKDKDSTSCTQFLDDRTPPLVSYAATPNNTPFDMTPPKSPDLVKVEYTLPCCTQNHMEDDKAASVLSEDSDFGGSLVNLSSSDSELDYVVVPMPACFNYLTPPVTIDGHVTPPSDFKVDENCNSSVTTATDTEDDTPIPAPLCAKQNTAIIEAINATVKFACSAPPFPSPPPPPPLALSESDEDNESEHVTKGGESFQSPKEVFVEAESGENVAETNRPSCDDPHPPEIRFLEAEMDEEDFAPEAEIDDVIVNRRSRPEPQVERERIQGVLPILPEPIVSAAATMFNSACAMFSTLQETQRRPSVFEPSKASEHKAELNQLLEMGFCDRDLNLQLLQKHNGDVSNTVLDLLVITDNNWYASRH